MGKDEVVTYRALLIEGDPIAREMARAGAVEFCPELDLIVLGGASAALDWLKGGVAHRAPDFILIDLELPKLDGLALLRTIRTYPAMRSVPIVVFSSEHTPAEVLISYRAGANSFVAKPLDEAHFGDLSRAQLSYWVQAKQGNVHAAGAGDAAGRI